MRNLDMMELANEAFGTVGPFKEAAAEALCATQRGTKECGLYTCKRSFYCKKGFTCKTIFNCQKTFKCVNDHTCQGLFTEPGLMPMDPEAVR